MMNSESEAEPSPPHKKEEGPFGPLQYDERARDIGDDGKTGPDLNDIRSGGPPPSASEVAVRRGELAVLKGAGASVIYEMAVRCFLEMGRPAVLVDGGCQADPYEVAAIAKRMNRELADGRRNDGRDSARSSRLPTAICHPNCQLPTADSREVVDAVLRNIYVARAFTAHQMEALIVERLGPMVERVRPVFVGVMSLDALFRDDELDRYEAKIMQARCTKTLRRMAKDSNLMVAATEGGDGRGMMRWW